MGLSSFANPAEQAELEESFVSDGKGATVAQQIKHIRIYVPASKLNGHLLHYTNSKENTLLADALTCMSGSLHKSF